MRKTIIKLVSADVAVHGKKILSNITWQLKEGEHWVFAGANGAGKSTLLKLIRGDIWLDNQDIGQRIYMFDGEEQTDVFGVKEKIAIVSAEKQDAYKKYNCGLNGKDVILTGFFDSVWLMETPNKTQLSNCEKLIKSLRLEKLANRRFNEMSQGETRKLLIARALVSQPQVLILDEFCDGLDAGSYSDIMGLIDMIAHNGETQLIFATHRINDICGAVTNALLLKDGNIIAQGEKHEILIDKKLAQIYKPLARKTASSLPVSVKNHSNKEDLTKKRKSLIKIEDVDVYINLKMVLSNINWQIYENENWAVLGENGAGKSTLLKLVHGDASPAYGGTIDKFGVEGLMNVWDAKKMIGYISPDFQARYIHKLTGEDVVLSGFFASIGLWENSTNAQKDIVKDWMHFFAIDNLAKKRTGKMSYGEFRKLLIARAMVNNPAILLLDEPCSGLDPASKEMMLHTIDTLSQTKTSIIISTHQHDELSGMIDHALILDNGKIANKGKRSEVLKTE